MLGPRLCARAPSSRGKRGPPPNVAPGPPTITAPPPRSTGFRRPGPAIAAHGPSRPSARGIPPDQGPNPQPPHRQADPQPLRHQGSPVCSIHKYKQGVENCQTNMKHRMKQMGKYTPLRKQYKDIKLKETVTNSLREIRKYIVKHMPYKEIFTNMEETIFFLIFTYLFIFGCVGSSFLC